jgi:hypothetical protein
VRPKSAGSCSNLAVCDSDLLPFERVTQGRHQDLQESVYCRLSHSKRRLARVGDFFFLVTNAELAATMGVDLVVNKMEGIPKLVNQLRHYFAALVRATFHLNPKVSISENKKAEC